MLLCAALCCLVAKSDASSMSATFLAQHLQYFLHANDMVKWFRRNRARANKNSRSRCFPASAVRQCRATQIPCTSNSRFIFGAGPHQKIKDYQSMKFVYICLHYSTPQRHDAMPNRCRQVSTIVALGENADQHIHQND